MNPFDNPLNRKEAMKSHHDHAEITRGLEHTAPKIGEHFAKPGPRSIVEQSYLDLNARKVRAGMTRPDSGFVPLASLEQEQATIVRQLHELMIRRDAAETAQELNAIEAERAELRAQLMRARDSIHDRRLGGPRQHATITPERTALWIKLCALAGGLGVTVALLLHAAGVLTR